MRFDAYDAIALAGLCLMGLGIHQLSPAWSCIIVGGLVLLWGAAASAAQSRRSAKDGG